MKLAIFVIVLVLAGCRQAAEKSPEPSEKTTNGVLPSVTVLETTSLVSLEKSVETRIASIDQIIQIGQHQASLKGLENGEVAFAAYDTNSTIWWVGIKSKSEDPLALVTVCISKDGKTISYLPPGHKIAQVEAVELSKRAAKVKRRGTTFDVMYSRKYGDIWFVGLKINARFYGGGEQVEVSLGPTGRLISVKTTDPGFRL